MSPVREQLITKALAALCEVADGCGDRPAAKSLMLRFCLMYTYAAAGADPAKKWIWDDFWQHATSTRSGEALDSYVRRSGARSALNGICREAGYQPDTTFLNYLKRQTEPTEEG